MRSQQRIGSHLWTCSHLWRCPCAKLLAEQAGADSRAQARAYMEMMRDLNPPLTGQSRWSATRERIRQDERFKV